VKRDGYWPLLVGGRDPFQDATPHEFELRGPGRTEQVPVAAIPSPEELARVAADYAPGVGGEAPDRILGPWTDMLDAHCEGSRRALLYAVANACFVVPDDDVRTPFTQWCRRTPAPSAADRRRFRVVEHSAWDIWPVESWGGGGAAWQLGASVFGQDHVELRDAVALLPGIAPRWVVGRRVVAASGSVCILPIATGALPPQRILEAWDSEHRRRSHGHGLVRAALEADFLHSGAPTLR
jgi:hypothetical protein